MDAIFKSARRMYPFLCLYLSVGIPALGVVAPGLLLEDVHWKIQDGGRNAVKGWGSSSTHLQGWYKFITTDLEEERSQLSDIDQRERNC